MTELESCFGDREGSIKKNTQQVYKNCVSVKPYICNVRIRDTFQRRGSECAEQKGKDTYCQVWWEEIQAQPQKWQGQANDRAQAGSESEEEGREVYSKLCLLFKD